MPSQPQAREFVLRSAAGRVEVEDSAKRPPCLLVVSSAGRDDPSSEVRVGLVRGERGHPRRDLPSLHYIRLATPESAREDRQCTPVRRLDPNSFTGMLNRLIGASEGQQRDGGNHVRHQPFRGESQRMLGGVRRSLIVLVGEFAPAEQASGAHNRTGAVGRVVSRPQQPAGLAEPSFFTQSFGVFKRPLLRTGHTTASAPHTAGVSPQASRRRGCAQGILW